MKLSDRLRTIADLVTDGKVLCDVGTDHAHIPIALVQEGHINKAFAVDIGEGPLEIAASNIKENALDNSIFTRLSDGLNNYSKGEADCILIAGMGGDEVIKILDEGIDKFNPGDELIVSPHTKIHLVRKYLRTHGFRTVKEVMVIDAGKYYTAIKSVYDPGYSRDDDLIADYFGSYLIENKDPITLKYLDHELEKLKDINNYINLVKEAINEMQ